MGKGQCTDHPGPVRAKHTARPGVACPSVVPSFTEALSNAHLLKLSLVSTTFCSFWQLFQTATPLILPQHIYCQIISSHTSWDSKVFSHGLPPFHSFSPSGGNLLCQLVSLTPSLQSGTVHFPSPCLRPASPPSCLIFFILVTGPFFSLSFFSSTFSLKSLLLSFCQLRNILSFSCSIFNNNGCHL